jgi:lysophospholipase L1-like esterase
MRGRILHQLSILKILFAVILIRSGIFSSNNTLAAVSAYDTTRIFHAMAKARRDEDITIAVIGGSITAGSLASAENKRWANIMKEWWVVTFPGSNVGFVNAGIGGTGSDIGAHRIGEDVLDYDPDFIVVEFSVNDAAGQYAEKMMEGLIRQILQADSLPGVMMLLLKQQNGISAQSSHKLVGEHYNVPMVSFADMIDTTVASDGRELGDIYVDGLHPNDLGMQYMADFLIDELTEIYNVLPDDQNLPQADTALPAPLITDTYAHTYRYKTSAIVPEINSGWTVTSQKWHAGEVGAEMSFIVDGNAISVLYSRHNTNNRGRVEVWIDDMSHKTLDAYWTETWGPATVFSLIEENLPDGQHTLHIKVIEANSTGTDDHYFELLNILKAGNWLTAAPIANAGESRKVIVSTAVELNGSESYDPDNDSIVSYKWSVIEKPDGSLADIKNNSGMITEITPDVEGRYRIGLTVNDGIYNSIVCVKIINVKESNTVPVANAGPDRNIPTKEFVSLDGSFSIDEDEDPLSYNWRIISMPDGSNPVLTDKNTPIARFRTYDEGVYIIGLVVNDSITGSTEDSVTLTAIDNYTNIESAYDQKINFSCYPNPAGNRINVKFCLLSDQHVNLSIYSLEGITTANLLSGKLSQGSYDLNFHTRDIISNKGIYIIKLHAGQEVYTDKIILN